MSISTKAPFCYNELSNENKKLLEKSDELETRIEKLESTLYQLAEVK